MNRTRRELLAGISIVGAGTLLAGCKRQATGNVNGAPAEQAKAEESTSDESGGDVSAVEDLMREHGVLRRALLVYQDAAAKLRENATSVPLAALEKTAQLFRAFGEEYHEKKLEEVYIIPSLKKVQGPATVYTDVLLAQHARGREITDYILAVTKADKLPAAAAGPFVETLEAFVRMYEHHAAIEDTVIFPAWKESLSDDELDSLGGTFEEIETAQFGEDGFEAALKRMAEIEESLGLANLGMFTAPAPPAPPPLPSPSAT